jgi:hypothetical protein
MMARHELGRSYFNMLVSGDYYICTHPQPQPPANPRYMAHISRGPSLYTCRTTTRTVETPMTHLP